ncbi:cytochrome P450 4V2-like [Aphis craccivora]|uniref:Cytochrome P450 4V2-like n=1 Tax=Aphis craccivora TaxID=307492 RepID=A0A6G0YND3_APHCR|nr:cytochrome P450 4V2-like [Aphis craccivora]
MLEPNLVYVVLILTTILISCAIWSRLRKPLEYRRISSHVPSLTKNLWNEMLFSCTIAMKHPKDLLPFFKEIFQNNGPVVHANITGRSYVLLNDPDDIKILLSSTSYINKGPEYEMLKPWLNDGLLLSKGLKWQNRRKLLTNTFHFKTLDMYNPAVNKHAKVFAKNLLDACVDNKEISISEYVTLCSLDIICETIMGTEMNAQKGKSVQYVHSIKSACRSVIDRIFKFWLWNDLIYRISNSGRTFFTSIKVLHEFTDNVIKRKQSLLKNSGNQKVQPEIKLEKNRPKSFLDLLLDVLNENPDQMTIRDIREEVDTFLFEGHDTSSIAMTMTILLLGLHQDIQDHAREELYSIFGDSDRDATMEDLNAMRYLDAVIKETLRLYPSVPSFTRELNTTLQLKKYTIPPMTTMAIFPYILHRNENIYPKPEEFIPERFLDEENKSKFLFGYIPFSAGARNCIGQKYAMNQMKTVISTVLRNAKIVSSGCKEDIKISMQLLIRIESLPKFDDFFYLMLNIVNLFGRTVDVTEMIDLNVYGVVLISLVGLISYAIWSRLRMPLEYRQISSHVPSATKTFWSEMQMLWKMAMLKPKGTYANEKVFKLMIF